MEFEASAARSSLLQGVQPTPLPMRIVSVLCVVIFSEPMSMTVLFPFVYFMVRDFGMADEKDIGFYVGFIASSFSLAQFLTSIFWGWTSDKIGRRPVLLIGLIGNALTILAFGQSHSLAWAIASRAACGFLNGNIGVAKSVMGEITDATNQAKGFSIFGLVWALGMICGPMLGGLLTNPAQNFPSLFGNCVFLKENPYFLPCFLSACVSMTGFVIGFFYLEETKPMEGGYVPLPESERDDVEGETGCGETDDGDNVEGVKKRNAINWQETLRSAELGIEDVDDIQVGEGSHIATSSSVLYRSISAQYTETANDTRDSVSTALNPSTPRASQTTSPTRSFKKRISITETQQRVNDDNDIERMAKDLGQRKEGWRFNRAVVRSILGYGLLAFQCIIFDETFSLWSVTPSYNGGLGFSSSDIGIVLSLMGCVTLFMQLFVYPQISRILNPLQIYRMGVMMYVFVFPLFPFISTIPGDDPEGRRWIWPALIANMAARQVANVLSFTSVMIMINNSAEKGQLGIVNGIGQTSAAFVRSIGPALGGIMWAWSLTNGRPFPFNYWFVFVVLLVLAVITKVQAHMIPKEAGKMPEESGEADLTNMGH
ncbi:hypothetical protein HDV05_002722 [Chytridiales sp. JEL 0842]|nr:hypothetical protein HDV05_002722 [Chytridiales sp. JEL 0842]